MKNSFSLTCSYLTATVVFSMGANARLLGETPQTVGLANARVTISLDGTWELAESVSEAVVPKTFEHKVSVPGLARLAKPSFPAKGIRLESGEERVFNETISIPGARCWSPEDPYLYTVCVNSVGDEKETRFGMRELRFDPSTKRAYLNGKIFFLRGGNLHVHRFYENSRCKEQPWNRQ